MRLEERVRRSLIDGVCRDPSLIKEVFGNIDFSDYPELYYEPRVVVYREKNLQRPAATFTKSQANIGILLTNDIESFTVYGGAIWCFLDENWERTADRGLPKFGGGFEDYNHSTINDITSYFSFSLG